MGFLDNLTEIATDLAQSGAAASKHLAETSIATSKRLAEIAKLKTSNLAEEGSIKKAYAELGRLYYAEHGNTPEGAYAAACERMWELPCDENQAEKVRAWLRSSGIQWKEESK